MLPFCWEISRSKDFIEESSCLKDSISFLRTKFSSELILSSFTTFSSAIKPIEKAHLKRFLFCKIYFLVILILFYRKKYLISLPVFLSTHLSLFLLFLIHLPQRTQQIS